MVLFPQYLKNDTENFIKLSKNGVKIFSKNGKGGMTSATWKVGYPEVNWLTEGILLL